MVVARIFWSWSQGDAGKYSAAACGKPSGEGEKGENGTVRDEKDMSTSSVVSAPFRPLHPWEIIDNYVSPIFFGCTQTAPQHWHPY